VADQDVVTLASQVEGPEAGEATWDAWLQLNKLLRNYCRKDYSPDVVEFAPILRIDGKYHQWKREGCANLRRSFKERYITIDVFVPVSRWKNRTDLEIRKYFADSVREGLTLCIERLHKDGTQVDGDQLLEDYEMAVKEYLR